MTIKTILEFSSDFNGAVEASIEVLHTVIGRIPAEGAPEGEVREKLDKMISDLEALKKKAAQRKFTTRNFGLRK